jgi:NMD protein affecting ribosome stability and mRNA decay
MRFCWIDIASEPRPKEASMRTNHTYVCTECGKEHAKDWAYKPGHDDDPAMCDACFDRQAVVESVKDGVATLRNKRTGIRWQIPATAVKAR